MMNISQYLFSCPLCCSISIHEREQFLLDMKYTSRQFRKGDTILSQGMEYNMFYILVKGEVRTEMFDEKGESMHIEKMRGVDALAPGLLFAQKNILPVTAVAETDCWFICLSKENVFFLMRKYDVFMKSLLGCISDKVALLSEKIRIGSLRSIKAKLAYYIVKEAKSGNSFHLTVSKQVLSNLFGVSRPALMKVMKQLSDEGIIAIDKRKITILRQGELQKMF